jgi:hypothetical protein
MRSIFSTGGLLLLLAGWRGSLYFDFELLNIK